MKVSVFMITYNHGPFIAQAIESIVSQKTNFDFELVIGEDCSTDNTLAICKRYAEKYPGIINLLPSDRNYGPMPNTIRTLEACNGEYIAMCEGDDYWLTTDRLQKQVDFMDTHPDFSMCFSAVEIIDEIDPGKPGEYYFPKIEKEELSIRDFVLSGMSLAPTSTVLYRNIFPRPFPDALKETVGGDVVFQIMAADKGKAKYFSEKMGIYRNHGGGLSKTQEAREKGDDMLMHLYGKMNEFYNYKYDDVFRERFLENARYRLIFGARDKKGVARLAHYFKKMPQYLKHSKKINIKEILFFHLVLFFPSFLKLYKKKKV